jgi:hypothetical protein
VTRVTLTISLCQVNRKSKDNLSEPFGLEVDHHPGPEFGPLSEEFGWGNNAAMDV